MQTIKYKNMHRLKIKILWKKIYLMKNYRKFKVNRMRNKGFRIEKVNFIKIIRKNKKHRNSKIKDLIFIKCGISLKDTLQTMA